MTVTVGSKKMVVKEWFANKIANELQRNLYFDVYVFAIKTLKKLITISRS